MKNLILIGGAMGVGKTAACRKLQMLLPNNVFLDGDWCWDASPFAVTRETKAMVMDNIAHMLSNFLACSAYDNIIFCWVMHQQTIIDDILARLAGETPYSLHKLSLVCSPQALAARLQGDIDAGIRSADSIERSLNYQPLYDGLDTVKIHTDGMAAQQVAQCIASHIATH